MLKPSFEQVLRALQLKPQTQNSQNECQIGETHTQLTELANSNLVIHLLRCITKFEFHDLIWQYKYDMQAELRI